MDFKRALEILNEYGFELVDICKWYAPICWNNAICFWIDSAIDITSSAPIRTIHHVSAFKKAKQRNLNNFDPSLIGSFNIEQTNENYLREQCEKVLAKAKKWFEQDQINMARRDFV
jgi:hypothetical protein